MGSQRLAPHQKKARRLNASLVFLDESGLLMAPLVRRTWAPRGNTPILYQRTRSHQKVSMIAALSLPPRRRRVSLYFSLRANANVTVPWLITFLRQLLRQIRRSIILVWDRLPGHRARRVQALSHTGTRLHLELLPPYAPELNPVEALWSYLKKNPLANFAAPDALTLARFAGRQARTLRRRPTLLHGLLGSSPLFSSSN